MKEDQANLEEVLFEAVLQKPSAAERVAFVDGVCRDNPALRARLDMLLEAHFGAKGFLAPPSQQAAPSPSVTMLSVRVPMPFPEETPAQMIGRYKLLEKIGEGGFGEVWMAEQREPVKRRVAFKIIKLGMDTRQVVARFEAERQALALMDHPNIAKILDAGVTGTREEGRSDDQRPLASTPIPPSAFSLQPSASPPGRPYFVMELVRGLKITDYCDQNQLPTRERLKLFILVCQAIQHAHQKGIIHRDIKPSNILVTLHDGVPVPKVIDFGIAKATQQELTEKTVFTQFQQFIGTPAYISPEQAEMSGLDIDTRADIYSLGVLLYELLVGQTPFDAKEMIKGGLDALRQIIREKEPLRPSTKLNTLQEQARTTAGKCRQTDVSKLVHQLQGDLDWIAMKCLEKDRTRRYDTANGLAADIQRHLANEPVVARPPSATYRLQKLIRRNRLAFAATALVTLALLLGTGISIWQAIRATQARKSETQQRLAAQAARANALAAQAQAEDETRKTQDALAASNHEQGKGLLVMAKGRLEQNDVFAAKLIAASAIGFSGFGREQQPAAFAHLNPDLLRPGSAERGEVTRLLRGQPDFMRLWASPDVTHHGARIVGLAPHPDGRRLISAGADGTINVWNLAGGERVSTFRVDEQAGGVLSTIDLSPDGRWLASASRDRTIKIWDTATWKEKQLLRDHADAVVLVRFSPDGKTLVSASKDGALKVWETGGFSEKPPLNALPLAGEPTSLEFHPEGRFLLVTVGSSQPPRLWDLQSGSSIELDPDARAERAAFSSDGRFLAMIQKRKAQFFLNLLQWEIKGEMPSVTAVATQAVATSVGALTFSPDNGTVACGGSNGAIIRFSLPRLVELPPIQAQWREIGCLAFTPDGKDLLAAGGPVCTIRSFEMPSGKPKSISDSHAGGVSRASFSPNGKLFASAGQDGDVRIWETATGRTRLILRGQEVVQDVVFRQDGTLLASASGDGTVRLWDTTTGAERGVLRGHTGAVLRLAVHPGGQGLASGGIDGSVRFWSWDGTETHRINGRAKPVMALAFGPEGRQLAFAQEKEIELWDWAQQKALRLPLAGHATDVGSIAFSPDGALLASGGQHQAHGETRLWDLRSGTTLQRWYDDRIFDDARVAFTPDGRHFLRCLENRVEWYEISREQGITTRPLAVLNKRIHDPIQDIALSPDGRLLLTSHIWSGLELWEVSRGKEVMEWSNPDGDDFSGWGADLSPDGRLLATGTRNGFIRIWELATGRLLHSLKSQETPEVDINLNLQLINASPTPKDSLTGVQFSPDGQRLYSVYDRSGIIKIWEFKDKWREAASAVNGQPVLRLELSPDGTLLATASYNAVRIWDAKNLGDRRLGKMIAGGGWPGGTAFAFHPNRPLLAVNGDAIRVFDLTDPNAPREVQRIQGDFKALKYSPDGKHLAALQWLGPDCIFDAETGELVGSLGPTDSTRWASDFSPDGRWLAVGSEQKMVRIWELQTGQAAAVLRGHSDWVNHVQFSPDGRRLVTVCSQTVRVWDMDRVLHESLDYASHLQEFKIEGEKLVGVSHESISSTNLYQSVFHPFRPASPNSVLGSLKQTQDQEEQSRRLFWHYYRGQNLASARAVLDQLEMTGRAGDEREALAELCLTTARGSFGNQRFPLALLQVQIAAALAPDDPENWHAEAEILLQDGDYLQALSTVDRAIQSSPQAGEFWATKATILGRLSNEKAAAQAWGKAVDLVPESQKPLYMAMSQAGKPMPQIADADGWIPLFDDRTLSGWRAPNPSRWEMKDGQLTGQGARSHLFSPYTYTNFEVRAEVKVAHGGNGGIYFRAAFGPGDPRGYEAQLANTHPDPRKTGSLWGFQDVPEQLAQDDTWFTQHIVAIGNRIIIRVNDRIVLDFIDEKFTYTSGHLALQQMGTSPKAPGTVVTFRNVMVKPLPHDPQVAWAEVRKDMP